MVSSCYQHNIWGTDLADMQLISKFNKRLRFFLRVIEIYRKYAWAIPLKDNKGLITEVFQKYLEKPGREPNKIWSNQGSEFSTRSKNSLLHYHDIHQNVFDIQ